MRRAPWCTLFPYTTLFRSAFRAEELAGRLLFVRAGVIWQWRGREAGRLLGDGAAFQPAFSPDGRDRKSTRLNSSHPSISYAVFCLKKNTPITKTIKPPRHF